MSNTTRRPSLDRLAGTLRANQANGTAKPTDPAQQITVDNEAGIQVGDVRGNSAHRTQLTQDTYSGIFGVSRHEKERRIVKRKMPANTRGHTTTEGIAGWIYSFDCQFGQRFELFLFYDGSYYQVLVISPRIEKHWDSPHTGHIFSDGRICMSQKYGGGQPTVDDAYAKSVIWATGLTAAQRGGIKFPFNHNQ